MTSARYTADKSVNLSDLEVDSSPPGTWKHQCPCGDPIDILGTDVINRRTIYPCTVCNWTIFLQFGDLDVAFALFYGKRYLEAVEMYVLPDRRQSLCVNPLVSPSPIALARRSRTATVPSPGHLCLLPSSSSSSRAHPRPGLPLPKHAAFPGGPRSHSHTHTRSHSHLTSHTHTPHSTHTPY